MSAMKSPSLESRLKALGYTDIKVRLVNSLFETCAHYDGKKIGITGGMDDVMDAMTSYRNHVLALAKLRKACPSAYVTVVRTFERAEADQIIYKVTFDPTYWYESAPIADMGGDHLRAVEELLARMTMPPVGARL